MSVKVKPLEWSEYGFQGVLVRAASYSWMARYDICETLPGMFVVEFQGRPVAWGQTVEEAKAKAHEWYEAQIRECLEGET